jgi:hypothetical protein
MIRLVNKAVGKTLEVAIDVAEPSDVVVAEAAPSSTPSDGDPK